MADTWHLKCHALLGVPVRVRSSVLVLNIEVDWFDSNRHANGPVVGRMMVKLPRSFLLKLNKGGNLLKLSDEEFESLEKVRTALKEKGLFEGFLEKKRLAKQKDNETQNHWMMNEMSVTMEMFKAAGFEVPKLIQGVYNAGLANGFKVEL